MYPHPFIHPPTLQWPTYPSIQPDNYQKAILYNSDQRLLTCLIESYGSCTVALQRGTGLYISVILFICLWTSQTAQSFKEGNVFSKNSSYLAILCFIPCSHCNAQNSITGQQVGSHWIWLTRDTWRKITWIRNWHQRKWESSGPVRAGSADIFVIIKYLLLIISLCWILPLEGVNAILWGPQLAFAIVKCCKASQPLTHAFFCTWLVLFPFHYYVVT